MIIECPECGAKNQTTQPPQLGKTYRCGKCGASITFLQTSDTQDTLAQIPKEKTKDEKQDLWKQFGVSDKKTQKKIRLGCAVIVVLIVIGILIDSLTLGDNTEESSSSLIDLKASVIFDGAQFIISNNDNFDWTNIKFEINSGLLTGGYILRASQMGAGETYTVGALQFAKGDGERFNPFTHKVQKNSIWCDTTKGNGFWYGEW